METTGTTTTSGGEAISTTKMTAEEATNSISKTPWGPDSRMTLIWAIKTTTTGERILGGLAEIKDGIKAKTKIITIKGPGDT